MKILLFSVEKIKITSIKAKTMYICVVLTFLILITWAVYACYILGFFKSKPTKTVKEVSILKDNNEIMGVSTTNIITESSFDEKKREIPYNKSFDDYSSSKTDEDDFLPVLGTTLENSISDALTFETEQEILDDAEYEVFEDTTEIDIDKEDPTGEEIAQGLSFSQIENIFDAKIQDEIVSDYPSILEQINLERDSLLKELDSKMETLNEV